MTEASPQRRATPKDRFDHLRGPMTVGEILERLREQTEGARDSSRILRGARAE